MNTFSEVYKTLRRQNRKQYLLLFGCLFFSALLISSYVSMMYSPTILTVLPEGGDSRKQVMMIFVLTAIGCMVFSLYAAGLFFRQRSKDTGIFLALGADRRLLAVQVLKEMCLLLALSCICGIVLSIPFTRSLWALFRLLVVDTEEMTLFLDPRAFVFTLAFSLMVLFLLLFTGYRSIQRISVIDIIHESHRSEPIRSVPKSYGKLGIALLCAGVFLGYQGPSFFMSVLHWNPPDGLSALLYLPALTGLYMILLHTVVNGWRQSTHRYKNLVSDSQMKFQGRQTVQTLLVMSILIAGAYFASFYTPVTGTGSAADYSLRQTDFLYRFRMDQKIPRKPEVQTLADRYDVEITDWTDIPAIRLGVDGMDSIWTQQAVGMTEELRYRRLLCSALFLPESAYASYTGDAPGLKPGTLGTVFRGDANPDFYISRDVSLVTNTLSGQTMKVDSIVPLKQDTLFGYYVMNDEDFLSMETGLSEEWKEMLCLFNVTDWENSYDFAKALFYDITDHSDQNVELFRSWDPVVKQIDDNEKGFYFLDPEHIEDHGFERIDYNERDSSAFRLNWEYMPKFRILDKQDFLKTFAVYFMLFIFIAIVCFAAVFVIAFTRTMTIVLSGRLIYEDLRRLGASDPYLYHTVRDQAKRVFLTPAVVGTSAIYCFFAMILYFNDQSFSTSELTALWICALVAVPVSLLYYGIYRVTLRKACRVLDIRCKKD